MNQRQYLEQFNLFELIGLIIGDGSIWNYPKHHVYGLEITGNAYEDKEYFEKVSDFIETLIDKRPKIRIKTERLGKSLKLVVYSKKFSQYLINDIGITNINKTFTVTIPDKYLNWRCSRHVIRGIFESDGSLYFSKSRNIIGYPRIEIKTSSLVLARQIKQILAQRNFKPQTRTSKSDHTTAIYLSGIVMLEKWYNEIGFGSIKNISKYLFWKKLGYYIPRISLQDRLEMLGEVSVSRT